MLLRGLTYLKVTTRLIPYLLAILLAIVDFSNYLFGYRSSDIYKCDEAKELRFSFPAGPVGTNILLVGHLCSLPDKSAHSRTVDQVTTGR